MPSITSVFLLLSCLFIVTWVSGGDLDKQFRTLLASTEDKEGLESIRMLHSHLDDDKDGSIEPAETGEFIRGGELRGEDYIKRQKLFHRSDVEITVLDLWQTWTTSTVHNWTVDQTIEWLLTSVDLPQYKTTFEYHSVNGSRIPQIAVNSSYLTKVLKITNPIHKSKLSLKAMDVVLFGPPKEPSSFFKDVIFTIIILLAGTGLFYAYHKNKKSQDQLKKMMEDMDKLGVAERDLLDLQSKLQQKDKVIKNIRSVSKELNQVSLETEEIKRMREEIEDLRNQLYAAETELEDKCWSAPPTLQLWLQISYEIESMGFSAKKKEAEKQLELAKDMCEKLKKKRSSFVGAFVSTHGHSINDIDKMILEARAGLLEVTKDLQERTSRWKQIEMLCGVSIVSNPGLNVIQKQVRTIGGRGRLTMNSRMSSRMSEEFLDDSDTHSVAPSMSSLASIRTPAVLPRTTFIRPPLSRESSKESATSSSVSGGSSDEKEMENFVKSSSSSSKEPGEVIPEEITTEPRLVQLSSIDSGIEKTPSIEDTTLPSSQQLIPQQLLSTSPSLVETSKKNKERYPLM
ncbi:stromal interaction molecule homolog isoform X2 [Lepeophtheirus salmonis]|uniref:stromal interaction molecule homolog isoform X2 n=1 Tax=Lepeophtheirus salmonis TaxID=72036 RepID=UPI001AE549AB|nr:stromal interaction molecule homolog isoform X2 [Lepeophtheirus salmonis]